MCFIYYTRNGREPSLSYRELSTMEGKLILSNVPWKQKPSTSPANTSNGKCTPCKSWKSLRRIPKIELGLRWQNHTSSAGRQHFCRKKMFLICFHIDFAEIKFSLDDTRFHSAVQGGGNRLSSYSRSQYTSTKKVHEFFRGCGLLAVIFQSMTLIGTIHITPVYCHVM